MTRSMMRGGRCVPMVLRATAIVVAVVVGKELIAAVRRQVPDVVAAARTVVVAVGGAYLFFFGRNYVLISVSLAPGSGLIGIFSFPPFSSVRWAL